MRKFLLVDLYNIFFRIVYAINERNLELKSALVLNSIFVMMNYLGKNLEPDHFVICAEGSHNWRKQLDGKYKLNRKEKMDSRTIKEVKHDEMMLETLNEFITFMKEKTNCTVLQCDEAEADDMIARFCALHPNDKITICSVDNDFIQLVNDNVSLFNGTQHCLITTEGVFDMNDKKGRRKAVAIDNKGKLTIKKEYLDGVGTGLPDNWQEYALFCKCVRGDSSDNIFPAYPRVMTKSTMKKGVKKVGLNEAFEHRIDHSYEWINFMNQTWKDIEGKEHKVEDEFKHNQKLIDFNYIPEEYKIKFDNYIKEQCVNKNKTLIGMSIKTYFISHEMIRQLDNLTNFVSFFSLGY